MVKRQKGRSPRGRNPKPRYGGPQKKGANLAGMHGKVKQMPKHHVHRHAGIVKAVYEAPHGSSASYTEIMLNNIISNKDHMVGYNSSLLLHGLASLTGSLRTISYRRGLSTGKSLYKMLSEKKHYSMYEESIPDLVKFLESLGIGSIAYSAFNDKLVMNAYSKERKNVGANMHTFEAGIISGFVSASRHQYTHVYEKECANNNSDHCEFVFSRYEDGKNALRASAEGEALISNIAASISKNEEASTGVPSSYLALVSDIVTNSEYMEEMKNIMTHIGSKIGNSIANGSKKHRITSAMNILSSTYAGIPEVLSFKPMSIVIKFDGTTSNNRYVDLSLAFLKGLLPNISNASQEKAIEINRYDFHKIKIAEEK